MKTNQKYEDFVMRTVRTQRTPRTLHEAYRSGAYGYSVHLFKDDVAHAWDFFKDMMAGFLFAGLVGIVVVAFLSWMGVV